MTSDINSFIEIKFNLNVKYLVGRFKNESCNKAVAAERSHEQSVGITNSVELWITECSEYLRIYLLCASFFKTRVLQ